MQKVKWKIRIAPSLGGGFEGTPKEVWGVEEYIGSVGHGDYPTVFMGLYGLPDFYELWRHKGRKCIFWCGSDITHFCQGYFLDEEGVIRIHHKPLARWINNFCESYVENEVEQVRLLKTGIQSKIVPSFLGNVADYQISFKPSKKPKLYTSVSGDDFKLYGWNKIPELARENPNIEFYLFGNNSYFPDYGLSNIFVRGRVPKEQMNEEVKNMQGALRLTEFDGFSEIIAKSLLWGQWPVSIIPYPNTLKVEEINLIKEKREANSEGRDWLLSVVNKYPWNIKSQKNKKCKLN